MARDWNGLNIGDEVIYQGKKGKITDLFGRSNNECIVETEDGGEYLVLCELCQKADEEQVELCPACTLRGERGVVFENATLKRCLNCDVDLPKALVIGGKVEEPIKGMKAILG